MTNESEERRIAYVLRRGFVQVDAESLKELLDRTGDRVRVLTCLGEGGYVGVVECGSDDVRSLLHRSDEAIRNVFGEEACEFILTPKAKEVFSVKGLK